MDKAKDEEVFAELVPELKTLARGWTWRACEAIPGNRQTVENIRSVSFFIATAAGVAILWASTAPVGYSPFDMVAGAIIICAICGFFISGLCGTISSEIRESILRKKAAHYSLEQREKLAEKTLNTFKQILKSACIDTETKLFIEQQGLNPDDVTSSLDLHIKWLREDIEKTVEELLSSKRSANAEALKRLAGSDSESIAGHVRSLREAQASVRSRAEKTLRKRKAEAKFEAFMNKHVPDGQVLGGESTPEGSTSDKSFDTGSTVALKGSQPELPSPEPEPSDTSSQVDPMADQSQTTSGGARQNPWSFPTAETVLLGLSAAIMGVFWVIAGMHGDPEWFNRGGALALVLVAVAEHTAHDRQLRKIRSKTYGDVMVNDPIIPRKTHAESIITGGALILLIIGTIVWGFGDFFYEMAHR